MKHVLNKSLLTFIAVFLYANTPVHAIEDAIADSIAARFLKQSMLLPLEKIYAQIDKPVYVTGETVWFRAHLVNAQWHVPDSSSRYVYAELISPEDSVVQRVKVMGESGVYAGHFKLAEDMPEGSYMLRFYTRFMENAGEEYFFKRYIRVGSPLSALYHIKHTVSYKDSNKNGTAELQFIDNETQEPFTPDEVRVRQNGGITKKVKLTTDQKAYISFRAAPDKRQFIYIEYHYKKQLHKQLIVLPPPEDFDVTFHPEGGNLLENRENHIAFKAINNLGYGEDINLILMNDLGDTIRKTESMHLGMGIFNYTPKAGRTYYTTCTNNKGMEKRFTLDRAQNNSVAIKAQWNREHLLITLNQATNYSAKKPLYITAFCRGIVLKTITWDFSKEYLKINKDSLPSGVIQLTVTDSNFNPLSERLVFNVNTDDITDISFATDKKKYRKRESVMASIQLKSNNQLRSSANLSVAITDNQDIQIDSTTHILSTILLTSDLKGNIERPACYFQSNKEVKAYELDLLMMTQGWRKYDTDRVLKGMYTLPNKEIEQVQEITGSVKGGILLNKTAKNYPVILLSQDFPVLGEGFTNEEGNFLFQVDAPDSTTFVIQAKTPKNGILTEVAVNKEAFPKLNKQPYHLVSYTEVTENNDQFKEYIEKADQHFIQSNGMRMIQLEEVKITGKRIADKGKSVYSSPNRQERLTAKQIEEINPQNLLDILRRFTGVSTGIDDMGRYYINIRGYGSLKDTIPLVLIDDVVISERSELENLNMFEIEEVEVLKGASAAIFGMRGARGAILITTKGLSRTDTNQPTPHIQKITPLGYQIKKEFYAPKYETFEEKNNPNPDLRSTIHWIPSLKTSDDGKATFEFYTADAPSDYTVIIEGVTSDGKLVYGVETISRKD